MLLYLTLLLTASASAIPLASRAQPVTPNPTFSEETFQKLLDAPTAADRFTLIQSMGVPTKFDFNPDANPNGGVGSGPGGIGILANQKTFLPLIGLGVAMSAGFLNPCGMNVPHTHSRATEFLTIVEGGNVTTGFYMENDGPPAFNNTLNKYQGAILPMGSFHFEFNDNCEPAVFIAAFSHEDPGLSNIGANLFKLRPDVVAAILDYPTAVDASNINKLKHTLPPEFIDNVASCLNRCGIKPSSS
ncbi:RmlC-like cupin [Rhizodiscina lignyota]|uniref:RmlC-like cupin n=1 Tax=Rhizodiscina lignyota TaxID=1504668 RepID=A0A9P4I941_9PEZI|nr:RmlC-like cupin [Rhizodiscina lignyota]